jgi:hypothetical protein
MKGKLARIRIIALFSFGFLLLLGHRSLGDDPSQHQIRQTSFGVSGGNVNDLTARFCCSGTLGSLVTNGTTQFILSNNHVLAREDHAAIGEEISQPGSIDNNCAPATIVAHLSAVVPLNSSTVDAALAEVVPGAMDPTGNMLDIGPISSTVRTPVPGLTVTKSGRSTGVTTGTISAVFATVGIKYSKKCKPTAGHFSITYSDMVVVDGRGFSAGGDSGALIVSNDSCSQPVALLVGGGKRTTVGNAIQDVLDAFSVQFVGIPLSCAGAESASSSAQAGRPQIGMERLVSARQVLRSRVSELMSRPSVLGVGVGASETTPGEPVIVIYVDDTSGVYPTLPRRINGLRVTVKFTEPFEAF